MSFLLDTFALFEWYIQGNQKYERYFKPPEERHLTKLSLMEFYFQIYHRMGESTAKKYLTHLLGYVKLEELTERIILESAAFRSKMLKKGRKLSYADCVNYVTAKHIGAKLLTGDVGLEGLENVEFVR